MTGPKDKIKGASVQLHSWDTKHGASGMSGFAHAQAKGLNVGHVAMNVSFPATPEGLALVEKYCMNDNGSKAIPFERHTQMVQTGGFGDGEKPEFKQKEMFSVYFSWWPGAKDKNVHANLQANVNEDNIMERPGANYGSVNPESGIELEQRTYKGPLGSERVTLAPHQVMHQRAKENTPEANYLKAQHAQEQVHQKEVQINLLVKKLEGVKKNTNTRGTISKLLDKYCDGWRDDVGNPGRITPEQAQALLENRVNPVKAQIAQEMSDARALTGEYKTEITQSHDRELDDKVNTLKETLALLPEDQRPRTLENWKNRDPATVARYEFQELDAQFLQAQAVKIFAQTNDCNNELRDFLFDGIDPPPKEDGSHPYGTPEAVAMIRDHWRDFLPEEHKNISKDDLTEDILREVRQNANEKGKGLMMDKIESENRYKNLFYAPPPVLAGINQEFITSGLKPDNEIHLPVSGLNTNENEKPGLNIEPMLEKMRELKDNEGKKFNLNVRNCSDTVGKILEAGAAEPGMKKVINPKNIGGGFGTPQAVLNGAEKAQYAYLKREGELNKRQKVSAKSPTKAITRASGWLLRNALNKNKNPVVRALSGVGVALMSPITAIAAGANAIGGAVDSSVEKSKRKIDIQEQDMSNPNQGAENKEITIGQDGIETPQQAIQEFINQSKQDGVIPTFDMDTMSQVFSHLNSDECDKQVFDEYMQATKDVSNKVAAKKDDVADEYSDFVIEVSSEVDEEMESELGNGHELRDEHSGYVVEVSSELDVDDRREMEMEDRFATLFANDTGGELEASGVSASALENGNGGGSFTPGQQLQQAQAEASRTTPEVSSEVKNENTSSRKMSNK